MKPLFYLLNVSVLIFGLAVSATELTDAADEADEDKVVEILKRSTPSQEELDHVVYVSLDNERVDIAELGLSHGAHLDQISTWLNNKTIYSGFPNQHRVELLVEAIRSDTPLLTGYLLTIVSVAQLNEGLGFAAEMNKPHQAKVILTNIKPRVSQEGWDLSTPLTLAAQERNTDLVKLFLQHGADLSHIVDEEDNLTAWEIVKRDCRGLGFTQVNEAIIDHAIDVVSSEESQTVKSCLAEMGNLSAPLQALCSFLAGPSLGQRNANLPDDLRELAVARMTSDPVVDMSDDDEDNDDHEEERPLGRGKKRAREEDSDDDDDLGERAPKLARKNAVANLGAGYVNLGS